MASNPLTAMGRKTLGLINERQAWRANEIAKRVRAQDFLFAIPVEVSHGGPLDVFKNPSSHPPSTLR